jgi:hypothetical protein
MNDTAELRDEGANHEPRFDCVKCGDVAYDSSAAESLDFKMDHERFNRFALTFPAALFCCSVFHSALATEVYRPITAAKANKTIKLTGHDLTIEQVVAMPIGCASN